MLSLPLSWNDNGGPYRPRRRADHEAGEHPVRGRERIRTKAELRVRCDGVEGLFRADRVHELKPGEGITMTRGRCHDLRTKISTGRVLACAVSQCNADTVIRFPEVRKGDRLPHFLCNASLSVATEASLHPKHTTIRTRRFCTRRQVLPPFPLIRLS